MSNMVFGSMDPREKGRALPTPYQWAWLPKEATANRKELEYSLEVSQLSTIRRGI